MKNIATLLILFLGVFFSACSEKRPGVVPSTSIWPYELYNKFNLRTVISSYSGQLKYYCASYPKDFFHADQVLMPNTDKIIIQNEERFLSFEFISDEEIILIDEVKSGIYRSENIYTIYYNEEFDDYRADTFFIKKREKCVPLIVKEDENSSQ